MPPFTVEQLWIAGGWTSGWIFAALMVVTFFRLLYTGKIRTGREVQEIRQDRDVRVHEAQAWKATSQEKDEVIRELLKQQAKLLDVNEVSAHVLKSLPRVEGGSSDSS
jgi:hypothetical protein